MDADHLRRELSSTGLVLTSPWLNLPDYRNSDKLLLRCELSVVRDRLRKQLFLVEIHVTQPTPRPQHLPEIGVLPGCGSIKKFVGLFDDTVSHCVRTSQSRLPSLAGRVRQSATLSTAESLRPRRDKQFATRSSAVTISLRDRTQEAVAASTSTRLGAAKRNRLSPAVVAHGKLKVESERAVCE